MVGSIQGLFVEIIEGNGFDGIVSIEGGEGEDVSEHDSYVIFDSSKVKVISESYLDTKN